MKSKTVISVVALALMPLAGYAAFSVALNDGVASVSASERGRELHVTKECSEWTGAAGDFCTITSSNLARIKVGSRVYYDQAAGIPAGLLDSNVVLDAGNGNRAVGRCTSGFGHWSRTLHVLGRNRPVRRVQCPCTCLPADGRSQLALGRDVQLQSGRLSRGVSSRRGHGEPDTARCSRSVGPIAHPVRSAARARSQRRSAAGGRSGRRSG